MNDKEIQTLATELSKSLKTPEDLNQLCVVLKKISIEAALGAELSDHLGDDSGEHRVSSNSRNGYSSKKILTEGRELKIAINAGTISETNSFDVFGNQVEAFGQVPTTTDIKHFYVGEFFDKETNHYHLRARNYMSTVGRFTSMDEFEEARNAP